MALQKEQENDHFMLSLKEYDGVQLDAMVHEINDKVSAAIDCTLCGNCCKTLVVSVSPEELQGLSQFLQLTEEATKEQYIEESAAGRYFISKMPCHFLADKKCTIYEQRFTDCREFPHLHKPGFRERFSGTLMHYGSCPIIYNVIEELKERLGFVNE